MQQNIYDKNLESKPLSGLYLIATPIGNLQDLSPRAADYLSQTDYVYAEDPRISLKLLQACQLKRSLRTYNEQANDKMRQDILELIKAGKSVALISDAGTPLISDPGYKLVTLLRQENLPVYTVPGPCALIAALSISGMPTDHFTFLGFPPRNSSKLVQLLKSQQNSGPLIFYESAKRIINFLTEILEIKGETQIFIARELTKLHETHYHGNISEVLTELSAATQLKGELVCIVAQPQETQDFQIVNNLNLLIDSGMKYLSKKDLSKFLSEVSNLKKSEIYNLILKQDSE